MKKTRHTSANAAKPLLRAALHKNYGNLTLLILMALVSALFCGAISLYIKRIFDVAMGQGSGTILELLALLGLLLVLYVLCELLTREVRSRFLRRANLQYREKIFTELAKKSVSAFSSERSGTYISMLTADAATVEQKIFAAIEQGSALVFQFITAMVLMFLSSWQLALITIVLSAIPMLVSVCFSGRVAGMEKAVSRKSENFVSVVKDILMGFPVVKCFQAEREVGKLYSKEAGAMEQAKFKSCRASSLLGTVGMASALVMQFGVFLMGAFFSVRGDIAASVVIMFVQLSNYIVTPVERLPKLIAEGRAALALMEKAGEALRVHAETGKKTKILQLGSGITCQNLRFAYTPGVEILCGVDTHFVQGRSYAIVGSSGCGKSTLLNLMLGARADYTGSLTVGGTEVRDASTESLYEQISIIQQNVFVFDATIEENITMFKAFPEAAIRDAVSRSGLRELIEAKGRDYRCGENGCNLSGGERQRISIARCLLKNTQVLLMDEATAALDAQTAASVTNAILDVAGLTRIIVTHKLDVASLSRFDEILVMRGGRITERGDLAALLAQNGYFAALYRVSQPA